MDAWDIKLAGKPYMFGGQPGFQLGAAVLEPAKPAEVGSITIASLHGGIGRGYTEGVLRYHQSRGADVSVPGEFIAGYEPENLFSYTEGNLTRMRPTFGYGDGAFGTVFVIAGQTLHWFDPLDPASVHDVTKTGSFPADSEYSGSAFVYNSKIIFGVINHTDALLGRPEGYGIADTIQTTNPGSVGVADTFKVSYGADARARAFWVENVGGSSTGLKWAPSVANAVWKGGGDYIEKPAINLVGIELGFPRIVWMKMVGAALLLFRADGAVIGADETGMLSVAGTVPTGGYDLHFGRRSTLYNDGVIIPGQTGLWSFDMRSLTMRPASGNYVQGDVEERLRGEVTAVGSSGPYGFYAVRRLAGSDVESSIYVVVRYSNTMSVHDQVVVPITSTSAMVTDLLAFYDEDLRQTVLYYLTMDEDTHAVTLWRQRLRLPSDQPIVETHMVDAAEVDIESLSGPTPQSYMTKLWTQVRGHFKKGIGGASMHFRNMAVDGVAIDDIDIAADGPFALPFVGDEFADRLGRELTSLTLAIDDPTLDSGIQLPIQLDFIWVPAKNDSVTLKLLVASEVDGNTGGTWLREAMVLRDELLALRGTVTSLVWDRERTWSVFVEGVVVEDLESVSAAGQLEMIATVQVRRL